MPSLTIVPQTLTGHYNGSAWSVVPSPNSGTGNNYLKSVTVIAPNDVWAVGYSRQGTDYQLSSSTGTAARGAWYPAPTVEH